GAGGGVAGEAHTGAGVVAEVAEHHHLDVARRAQVVGDAVDPAVVDRPPVVPGMEHGLDGAAQLLARIGGDRPVGVLADQRLEAPGGVAEIVGRQIGVAVDAPLSPQLGQDRLEVAVRHSQHHVPVHLQEPPVHVPREMGVSGPLLEGANDLFVAAEVENGVHHAGHREHRPGTHGQEEGDGAGSEGAAGLLLEAGHRLVHLFPHLLGEPPLRQHPPARFGGDGEPGWYRQAQLRHLRQTGAFATQQVLVALSGAEIENVRHCRPLLIVPLPNGIRPSGPRLRAKVTTVEQTTAPAGPRALGPLSAQRGTSPVTGAEVRASFQGSVRPTSEKPRSVLRLRAFISTAPTTRPMTIAQNVRRRALRAVTRFRRFKVASGRCSTCSPNPSTSISPTCRDSVPSLSKSSSAPSFIFSATGLIWSIKPVAVAPRVLSTFTCSSNVSTSSARWTSRPLPRTYSV